MTPAHGDIWSIHAGPQRDVSCRSAALTKLSEVSAGYSQFRPPSAPPRSLNKCGVLFGSDPDYLAAAAAVSPGGTIRNMKVETFSPGLNGSGSWLLTAFKLWRKAAIA